MTPSTKATLALPFTVGLIVFLFYAVITHPALLIYPLIFVSGVGIIGSVWYALYRCFGGNV
jgi:ABC-type anion transport system duplicated permease subunit